MSAAARTTATPAQLVQLLAMFVDTAAAQAAAPEVEAVPGVRWVRVVKPQSITQALDGPTANALTFCVRPAAPLERVAHLARAQCAGLLVDWDGASAADMLRVLTGAGALMACASGPRQVQALALDAGADGGVWLRAW